MEHLMETTDGFEHEKFVHFKMSRSLLTSGYTVLRFFAAEVTENGRGYRKQTMIKKQSNYLGDCAGLTKVYTILAKHSSRRQRGQDDPAGELHI